MAGGFVIEFSQFGDFDSFDILRSHNPIDANSPPEPLVAGLKSMFYIDQAIVSGVSYYYRVRVWRGLESIISDEVYVVSGDPHWDNVAVLMRFNKKNGELNAFYEEKTKVFIPRLGSATSIEVGTGRFGDCVNFGKSGSRAIQIPASYYSLADNDFTIEVSLRLADLSPNSFYDILGQRGTYSSNQSYAIYYYTGTGTLNFEYSKNGTSMDFITMPCNLPVGQWVDLSLTRSGDNLSLYINSLLASTVALPPGLILFESTAPHQLALSAQEPAPNTQTHNTRFDEFRVTVGVAREPVPKTQEFYNY